MFYSSCSPQIVFWILVLLWILDLLWRLDVGSWMFYSSSTRTAHSGYRACEPFMACQRMRLSRSSGHRSAASIGKCAEAYAFFRSNGSEIFFASGFISSSAILFGTEVNAARFGSGL